MTPQKPYTAPAREIWAWGIGAIACHLSIQIYGQANIIFTVGFALSPVIVSWCMMLPRIVDGIADPFIGHLSDETNTRWGRRKPYLVIGSVLAAAFLMALWWANPAWSHQAQFIYLFVFGTLFYIAYGIYTMAWTAMGYELTDDYNERSKVAAVAGLFLSIVTLVAQGWTYPLALRPLFHHGVLSTGQALWAAGLNFGQSWGVLSEAFNALPGGATNEINGMRWISAVAAALVIGSAFVATVFCKERFTHVNREHVPMLPALKATAKNRPFMILVGFKICQILGERAALGLLIYLAIYLVCGGDKNTATKITGLGATIGTVLGLCVLPALKPITKAIGKRNAQITSAAITFAAALSLPAILRSGIPNLLLIPAMIAIPLGTLNSTLSSAMVPDICDVDGSTPASAARVSSPPSWVSCRKWKSPFVSSSSATS